MSEVKYLLQIIDASLLEEGITQEDLAFVDLDIEFSPVIPCVGDHPYEVIETIGGNYLIPHHPIFDFAITPNSLKVMRYRYLINRKNIYS